MIPRFISFEHCYCTVIKYTPDSMSKITLESWNLNISQTRSLPGGIQVHKLQRRIFITAVKTKHRRMAFAMLMKLLVSFASKYRTVRLQIIIYKIVLAIIFYSEYIWRLQSVLSYALIRIAIILKAYSEISPWLFKV